MIQRIQTLYLLSATVLAVVCMASCMGYYISEDGEMVGRLFNLGNWSYEEGHPVYIGSALALFIILLIGSTLSFLNIFMFKHRVLQIRICTFCIILFLGWYAVYGFFAWYFLDSFQDVVSFRVSAKASLPCICLILLYLAIRGIIKDEKLVRSLDRLR